VGPDLPRGRRIPGTPEQLDFLFFKFKKESCMKVIKGNFGSQASPELASRLREMADRADAGEITQIIGLFVEKGEYIFMSDGVSMQEEVFLAKILDATVVRRLTR
jgi:hypothetical protein